MKFIYLLPEVERFCEKTNADRVVSDVAARSVVAAFWRGLKALFV
jgi:hypothetical protein